MANMVNTATAAATARLDLAKNAQNRPRQLHRHDRRVVRLELYPGAVLVVDMDGDRRHAPVGAVTAAAAKAQGAAGIVVDGVATDLLELRSTGLPVFARGTSCLTTKRLHGTESAVNVSVTCGGVDVAPGDWVLGDDNGVIVLSPREAAAVLEQALASDAAEPELLARIAAGEPLETLLAH